MKATDPDGDPLTYVLSDGTGTFAIGTDTGQITVAPDAVLDYETTRSYVVIVTASDDRGAVAQITVTINVIEVAESSVTPTGLAGGSTTSGGGTNIRNTISSWWSRLGSLWSPFNIAAMVSLLLAGLASLVASGIKLWLQQGSWLWLMPIVARRRKQPATAGAARRPDYRHSQAGRDRVAGRAIGRPPCGADHRRAGADSSGVARRHRITTGSPPLLPSSPARSPSARRGGVPFPPLLC